MRLKQSLTARFWLRFHASLIVAGTFSTGFLASFALLHVGLEAVLPRWLIAIGIAYAVFFGLVRLWLAYVGVHRYGSVDLPDILPDVLDGPVAAGARASTPVVRGLGGRFGGAGASESFGDVPAHALHRGVDGTQAIGARLPTAAPRLTATDAGKGSDATDFGFDVDGDGMLIVVLGAIAVAMIAVLAGSAIHFVWIAPELLTDAAFAALLSTGALPGIARASATRWNGHLLRATWKPLACTIVVAIAAALALGHWFPEARTLGEALRSLR